MKFYFANQLTLRGIKIDLIEVSKHMYFFSSFLLQLD